MGIIDFNEIAKRKSAFGEGHPDPGIWSLRRQARESSIFHKNCKGKKCIWGVAARSWDLLANASGPGIVEIVKRNNWFGEGRPDPEIWPLRFQAREALISNANVKRKDACWEGRPDPGIWPLRRQAQESFIFNRIVKRKGACWKGQADPWIWLLRSHARESSISN